ncbi:MAG: DUF5596 domain-containing protein [Spirochaetales bacterium]|nr:DUF5596 domain-containing protein [Spirochaetales bacterium]
MQHRFFDELGFSDRQRSDIEQAGLQLRDNEQHARLKERLQKAIAGRDKQTAGELLFSGMQTFGPWYPLLLIHSCYDQVCMLYDELCIEQAIRMDTLKDIRLWTQTYADSHDQETGLTQVFWVARHVCARILRLGRLQFEPACLKAPFRIYRVQGSTKLVTVAEAGLACDAGGYCTDEENAAFTTTLVEDGLVLQAHVVDDRLGNASAKPTLFDKAALHTLADSTTEVLHLHIPAGERLSRDAVDASLELAKAYFPEHRVVACTSWLLDPALSQVADAESNIVQFMERFSKFPVPFQTPQLFERVFSFTATREEIPHWKTVTTLQSAVQRALSEGVTFRTMGGYLLLE